MSVAGVGGVCPGAGFLEPVASRLGVDGEDLRHGQLRVVGLHYLSPIHVLDLVRGLKVGVGPLVERPLGVRNGHWRERRDLLGELQRSCRSIVDDLVDETELQSDFRGDDATPKYPVECACQTDESRDPLRAATTRNHSGTYLGIAVAEVPVLADPKVATEG